LLIPRQTGGQAIWAALEKTGISDDALLAQILGEMTNQEYYDKTLP